MRYGLRARVLTARSRALGACEPRQIREEAALSRTSQVPWVGLARASVPCTGSSGLSTEGAWPGICLNRKLAS